MTTDKNRFVAEKLGLCWHNWDWREVSQTYRCTKCNKYLMNIPVPTNPDFTLDAGTVQLLRLMEARKDYKEFISSLVESTYVYRGVLKVHHSIFIKDYITTPGALLDAVAEWFGWKEGK